MENVSKLIKKVAESHENRLHNHVNVEAFQFLNNSGLVGRLKGTKPFV